MESAYRIQGRDLREPDLAQLRYLIESHPDWSRRRISVALAQIWDWRTETGRLKDMAARSLLVKLEQRGLLALPPRRQMASRRLPLDTAHADSEPSPVAITGTLSDLQPLRLEVVTTAGDHLLFRRYLALHHYLGYRGPVGENLAYLARDRHGRDLACLLFGAAAWKTRPRDSFIGWDAATRARQLPHVANNSRFLILPWVRVPHLASHFLGRITRRLSADWRLKYGHPIHLAETFVERERFRGACYRAANWTCVGQTQGRSRQDRRWTMRVPVKDVYLYPLTPRFREELCRVDA